MARWRLVYRKACHLPIELGHKAYWALKWTNFDLKTAGDHQKFQMNELNEVRDQAYENSLIYKEKTKKIHDSKIKNREFHVGDRVLLFNSRLKIFSRKLKSRCSGPCMITEVFPYGTIELSQPNGPNFKVNGHRIKHYQGGDIPSMDVLDLQGVSSGNKPLPISFLGSGLVSYLHSGLPTFLSSGLELTAVDTVAIANLSEDIQCANSDTGPPMLDKTDFASWQQHIRLYCWGKENEVQNELESILTSHLKTRKGLSPTNNLIDNLTNTLALLTQSYKTYLPQTKNQLKTSSNTRNQATVQDGRVVVQHFQGRQNRGQGNNVRGTCVGGYRGAQNRVGNVNPGQARQIKCYNCNGIDHIARNCTQPKRPQNLEYFKDKILLMQAQRNGVALDEEQLLVLLDEEQLMFLAGGHDTAVDEDVDESPVQDLALNVDNVFQADEYPVYDEADPSYYSNILSEVHEYDNYQDAVCEHHDAHEMHHDVQPNCVVDSNADYTSNSNMIPYDQYVKDNAEPVVQSNVSYVPNDAYMMIINDMHEHTAQSVYANEQNKVVNASLIAELATYKEQVELYERRAKFELTKSKQKIKEQLRIVITDRNVKKI
ncbi:retrovirus-related pol polyprotein from transposon TNT 1-94 [Tanacetum coccineum]